MFTDTLEAAEPSWHQRNKFAQVFVTKFCWVRVFPIQKKSDVQEGLSLLASSDGVPAAIVMDNAREQTMGNFRKKGNRNGVPYQANRSVLTLEKRGRRGYQGTKAGCRQEDDVIKSTAEAMGPLLGAGSIHTVTYRSRPL